jgi:hypothetical protein
MAPSHPRPKPTPKVGSVSVDAIRLAIREAISRRRPRATLARFCMPPLSRFISVRPAYLTRGATNQRHASTRTRRAVLPNTETLPNCVKPPSRGGASSACYGGPRVRILLSPAGSQQRTLRVRGVPLERAPFSNSPARVCRRRCSERLGPPRARCCSLSASPLMIRSRLRPRGSPV